MDLSLLGGRGSIGLELAAGNILAPGLNTGTQMGKIGNIVSVASVDISGVSVTTVMSVDVVAGEQLMVKKLWMNNLTTTAADLTLEVEIDGIVVGTATVIASTNLGVFIFGHNDTGTQQDVTNVLQDVLVKSNLTLRARKTPAIAAAAFLTYVKLKRG